MDCSPPGSSVHVISRARILEWAAISFSRASSQLRNLSPVSCVSGGATREASKQQMLFSCSVVSNSLQPHGLQHTRLPCPSLSPGICSNSCPLSQWYYLTISSSAALFSFCLRAKDWGLFQYQHFSQWGDSSHQVVKVLGLQLQHHSFQWIFRDDFL